MSDRDELNALRRMAELESKAAPQTATPDFAAQAAGMSPVDLGVARSKNDPFGNYLREQASVRQPDETDEQMSQRQYGTLGYKPPKLVEGVGRSYLQGSTFGGGDEAVAGAAALLDPIRGSGGMGGTLGERYNAYLANERGKLGQFREAYPATSMAAEITGALPTALAIPMGSGAFSLGGRMVQGATSGSLQGGLYGGLTGEGEGRARSAERGAMLGGGIGAAAPLVGAGVQKIADRRAANRFIAGAPGTEALKNAKTAAYTSADAIAPVTPAAEFQQFVAQMKPLLFKEGMDETMTPKAYGVFSRFQKEASAASGPNGQLPDMDTLRRIAASVVKDGGTDGERRLGKILVNEFQGLIDNVSPQYAQALQDANKANSLFKKSEMLEQAIERGSRAASGAENGIRIEFNKILNNPKLSRGLSPEQLDAIKDVVEGTTTGNILRRVGKLSPGSGRQSSALLATLGSGLGGVAAGGITGSTLLGGAAAVGIPAVGYAAQKGAEASTGRLADLARALAATGQKTAPTGSIEMQRLAEMLVQRNAPFTAQLR